MPFMQICRYLIYYHKALQKFRKMMRLIEGSICTSKIAFSRKSLQKKIENFLRFIDTVEPLYSTIGGVHEMRSCYRRIVVK